jgi:tRNA threonylcarbamoyladenosine biosynthesis protein TsaB
LANRLILAIDNSMDCLNVALAREEKIMEERHIKSEEPPSRTLPPIVARILRDHGLTIHDVNVLVVSLGPGSFTGIRVALSFCKGLRAGGNIPLLGVPTLDVLAAPFAFMDGYHLLPIIDAKKGEFFCALYQVRSGILHLLTPYRALKPEAVRTLAETPCLCFGTGAALWERLFPSARGITVLGSAFSRISGEWLIREALRREAGSVTVEPAPIYGRRSEAEIKFDVEIR